MAQTYLNFQYYQNKQIYKIKKGIIMEIENKTINVGLLQNINACLMSDYEQK